MAAGPTELRETRADVLALPGLIAVALVAIVVRQLSVHPPIVIVFAVCAVVAALDVWFARFLLKTGRATFTVTQDDITFTPRQGKSFQGAKPQVIRRTAGSTLSFRLQPNGFVGNQPSYLLKLRDNATQEEISATTFGRSKVRRACESQGWPFS